MSAETKLLAVILCDVDNRITDATQYQEYGEQNALEADQWVYTLPPQKRRKAWEDIKPYEDDPDYLPRPIRVAVKRWATAQVRLDFAYVAEADTVIYRVRSEASAAAEGGVKEK